MKTVLEAVNRLVWGFPVLLLILGVGLLLSVATGFAQIRLFPQALCDFIRKLFGKGERTEGVSPFQALCTALAATVGTGNIAGVAGAITLGGPGAIFWMWVSALFGMITKYAEAVLAVHFRFRNNNCEVLGGPMYIIQYGMGIKWRWLATLYAFFGVVAAFGVGNATQINAVIGGIHSASRAIGVNLTSHADWIIGALAAATVAVLLLGGAGRIGRFAEFLVPFASFAYILMCLGVVVMRFDAVPQAFRAIFAGAFSPRAVTGGVLGSAFVALRTGVSRGVFTNEAGMGTAAIAHAGANVSHPVQQGLMGIMEVFLDTIVICTMTALAILCSGVSIPYGIDEGVVLTANALGAVYGDWISVPLMLFLCCFAFATMLGWGLYGVRCVQYLLGDKSIKLFVIIQMAVIVLSTFLKTGTVWMLSETVNGFMAIPNLIALAVLYPVVVMLTRDYRYKMKRASIK